MTQVHLEHAEADMPSTFGCLPPVITLQPPSRVSRSLSLHDSSLTEVHLDYTEPEMSSILGGHSVHMPLEFGRHSVGIPLDFVPGWQCRRV